MENVKKHDFGTKLLNELMVDIIGALIPGVLFIIVVFLSVILPLFVYYDGSPVLESILGESGFWWVLLIVCIFFAYVVGHIFYRADIAEPDKLDVQKQVIKVVNDVKKDITSSACRYEETEKKYRRLLAVEIKILEKRIDDPIEGKQWTTFNKYLKSRCVYAVNSLSSKGGNLVKNEDIFCVLFPEDITMNGDLRLSEDSNKVIEEYKCYFKFMENEFPLNLQYAVIYYCILHNQMDIGCATSKRCDFPYTNYYKYLLKRDLTALLKHVDWHTVAGRSKNKINALKIKIQVFANEAYALINKNESHIRMSSSTWHLSNLLKIVTAMSTTVFFILLLEQSQWGSNRVENVYYIAVLCPLLMLFLVLYVRRSIVRYIHYQRMREIQYTLQIYDQFKDIIDYRRNLYSGKIIPKSESDSDRKDCEVKVDAKIFQL